MGGMNTGIGILPSMAVAIGAVCAIRRTALDGADNPPKGTLWLKEAVIGPLIGAPAPDPAPAPAPAPAGLGANPTAKPLMSPYPAARLRPVGIRVSGN